MTKLSIIIPIYNGEKFIDRCIQSIISQDNGNLEIVLIDDGSKDKSAEICTKYASNYSYIYYFYKENGGVSSARNFGLKKITGDYVWFVDCDDEIASGAISEIFSIQGKDLTVFNFYRYIKQKSLIDLGNEGKVFKTDNLNEFFKEYVFCYKMANAPWNKIYKSEIINKHNLKFNENLKIGEDFLFNLMYYKNINNIEFKSFPIYIYYLVDGSAMQRKDLNVFLYQQQISNILKQEFSTRLTSNVIEQFLLMQFICGINQSKERGVSKKQIKLHIKNYMDKIMEGKRFSRQTVDAFLKSERASFLSRIKFKLMHFKYYK